MMITESEIYWLTRLDYFQGAAYAIGGTFGLLSFMGCITGVFWWYDDDETCLFKISCPSLIVSLCLIIGSLFIPSTKEMCAIKLVPIIVTNEQIQELPDKVLGLANDWLDELAPNKIRPEVD